MKKQTDLTANWEYMDFGVEIIKPLQMKWNPKEDITTHELALCLPLLIKGSLGSIMPYDVDKSQPHMRHFEIHDPNTDTP